MLQIARDTRQTFIKDLEIDQIEGQQYSKNQEPIIFKRRNAGRHIEKNELMKVFRTLVVFPEDIKPTKADRIVSKYFSYGLNPIYEKTSKLPYQLLFCGFCKEPYYNPAEFLLHCLQQQCPVNHNRSTFVFYLKDKFNQVKNSDIYNLLEDQQLQTLKEVQYQSQEILFCQYQETTINPNKDSVYWCGKCNFRRQQTWKRIFLSHCIRECRSSRHPQNSKIFTVIQHKQDTIEFVKDVENFVLNYNILGASDDSYVRVQKNPSYSRTETQNYCANCNLKFYQCQDFLQHALFECSNKPNPKSSHLVKRKMVPYGFYEDEEGKKRRGKPSNQQNIKGTQLKKIQQEKTQSDEQQQFETYLWQEKLNLLLQNFKDLLHKIYFCSNCLCNFENSRLFLAHCLVYQCPLKSPRNSHLFYRKGTNQPINFESLENQDSLQKSLSKMERDASLEKYMLDKFILINNETKEVERKIFGKFFCAKCKKSFPQKDFYLTHVIKNCRSINYQGNSHAFEISKQKMTEQQFSAYLLSYLFAVQIKRFKSNKRYKLTRNTKIDMDPDYLCGKCDTLFGNMYEYVLHSLSVCNSFRNKSSSHFLIGITCEQVFYPLHVVEFGESSDANIKKEEHNHLDQRSQQFALNSNFQRQKIERNSIKIEIEQPNSRQIEIEEANFVQKSRGSKRRQKVRIKSEQKREQQKLDEVINSNNSIRILRPNIDYESMPNTKYYCGQCQISLKAKQRLIGHFKKCENFQHLESSHFYITNSEYEKSYQNRVFTHRKTKHITPLPRDYPEFLIHSEDLFTCGCGMKIKFNHVGNHIRCVHACNVPKGSSHIILRMPFNLSTSINITSIFLPIGLKNVNPDYVFVCPCNPWKKFNYDEFVRHFLKRHQGKSQKFVMRMPENSQITT